MAVGKWLAVWQSSSVPITPYGVRWIATPPDWPKPASGNAKPFPAWHPALARRILTADRLTAITDCYYYEVLGTTSTGRVDELRELGDDCYCFNIIRAIVPFCLFFEPRREERKVSPFLLVVSLI